MGETFTALHERNEQKVADGLADLEYVTVGTAVQLDIPAHEVLAEVHRSNMTKTPLDTHAKGGKISKEGWIPPDVDGAIYRGREKSRMADALVNPVEDEVELF
jgi:predicted HAD superfamily Cof-like phosphohydrolase